MATDDERRERLEEEETQLLRRALGDDAARQVDGRLESQAMVEIYDVNGDLLDIVRVEPRGLSIGRGPDQDVRLADRTVSRRHARIEVVGEQYFIDDAGSLNDTLLNGELVRGRAELHDGSQLTIGLHVLRVTIR
ncbi:MAG: FHA domain-containing protein [Armatimonadetes bacterium]|nr:FHA domain-containing protein [Armatimonadota bacterium]